MAALLESPGIRHAVDRLKVAPERRISAGQEGAPKHVYVFQREYATVDPARVEVRGVALSRLGLIGLGNFVPHLPLGDKNGDLVTSLMEFLVYLIDYIFICVAQ